MSLLDHTARVRHETSEDAETVSLWDIRRWGCTYAPRTDVDNAEKFEDVPTIFFVFP